MEQAIGTSNQVSVVRPSLAFAVLAGAALGTALRPSRNSGNTNFMAKSISVTPEKRRRGRPATGRDPVMTVRLPATLTARIDAHAKSRDETRSEVMRRFLELGLAGEEPAVKPKRIARPK
jgi:Ribbon-helix-helix protein, copG family